MDLDGREKEAVTALGDAVNTAIEQSTIVSDAMDNLRRMGFEPNLNVKLEIALQELVEKFVEPSRPQFDFTEDDLKTLKRMKIKVDD